MNRDSENDANIKHQAALVVTVEYMENADRRVVQNIRKVCNKYLMLMACTLVASQAVAEDFEIYEGTRGRPAWKVSTQGNSISLSKNRSTKPADSYHGSVRTTSSQKEIRMKNKYGEQIRGTVSSSGRIKMRDHEGKQYEGYMGKYSGKIKDDAGNTYKIRRK